MKPIIGITSGEIRSKLEPWQPFVHGQSRTYVEAIVAAGGIPILLPVGLDQPAQERILALLDGLLLAGGNDVDPKLYGQKPYTTTTDFSPERDEAEMLLTHKTIVQQKPILAICRGMQLINVMFGGTLHQDIGVDVPNALDHESSTKAKSLEHLAHDITLLPGSRLANIVGDAPLPANTHHHQAVATVGKGITATGWASDKVIEAIELDDYPFVIGVQSHPESLFAKAEPRYQLLFDAFVAEAKARAD